MLFINHMLLHLRKFFLSPFFLIILSLVLFTLYFIYYGSPILCQGDETIYDLKVNLIIETHKYRLQSINFEMLKDTYDLMIRRNLSDRDFNRELEFVQATRRASDGIRDSFVTINQIVARIRAFEPTFQSPIQAIDYLRIARQ